MNEESRGSVEGLCEQWRLARWVVMSKVELSVEVVGVARKSSRMGRFGDGVDGRLLMVMVLGSVKMLCKGSNEGVARWMVPQGGDLVRVQ
ncbi:hypothetical protein V6N11_000623 [Hibiscus sabdariffa]|uniref:Uncharacterized protein n=1 Tax=Hibiscus sabdariffa TaxID=183260 RepID=A0ABR2N7P2_9ROSI